MTLRLHDTLRRSLEPFTPLEPGKVRVYACGPTIYNHAHIGNFRSFVFYDLVHRYLEWSGYDVKFVMNLTDVDDKTIAAAQGAGVDIGTYTEAFGEAFRSDSESLGIWPADVYPQATSCVSAMIDFIRILEEKGHAYAAADGSVYFSIGSFPAYGRLSRMDPEQMRPGARVSHDEYDKDDVRDFVLWKAAKEEDEEVGAAWDSPWGRGRPGWHIECSAMSTSELGNTLDIHLGGEDLIFPHHEDEIAQSEAATGETFVRNWLHVKHLMVEGRKMAKSSGNFIRLRELLDEGYEPAAIRHLLLSAHYRSELNFTRSGLDASSRAVQRLVDFADRLDSTEVGDAEASEIPSIASEALTQFREAMDDDLNSANAFGPLFTFVTRTNAALDQLDGPLLESEWGAARDALHSMDQVLGLIEVARATRGVDDDTTAWVEALIEERRAARASRDFARADQIRDELAEKGIVLEDSADGTRWKVVA